jgi:hypothetical protein
MSLDLRAEARIPQRIRNHDRRRTSARKLRFTLEERGAIS